MASRKSPRKDVVKDISRWLDRNQAADLLGCSLSMLQKLERRHQLTPVQDYRLINGAQRHVYVYDPHELAKIPLRDRSALRSPGELAARAFEMFDEGKNIREIVITLREMPDVIEGLKLQWDGMGGSDRVLMPASWDRLAVLVGNFSSIAELIQRVEVLAGGFEVGDDGPKHERQRATIREALKLQLGGMYAEWPLGDSSNPDYIGPAQLEEMVTAVLGALDGAVVEPKTGQPEPKTEQKVSAK